MQIPNLNVASGPEDHQILSAASPLMWTILGHQNTGYEFTLPFDAITSLVHNAISFIFVLWIVVVLC